MDDTFKKISDLTNEHIRDPKFADAMAAKLGFGHKPKFTMKPPNLSQEGLDVGNIVKYLLNKEPFLGDIHGEPASSIYRIGDVAVNFQVQGDTVIMRLVERHPDSKLENKQQ